MKTLLKTIAFLALLLAVSPHACAQLPTLGDMTQGFRDAASRVSERQDSLPGFKKLEMPKPLQGLLDIRFKKPELPKFGFLDKLKNMGMPQFGTQPSGDGPFAGLGKFFQPPRRTEPGFFSRMFGNSNNSSSLFKQDDVDELSRMTQGLQDHVGRMSKDARNSASELFGGPRSSSTPQPPLRSARQFPEQHQSRY